MFFRFCALSLFAITILAQCPNSNSHGGHGHSHDHADTPPSFKYSKQANQPKQAVKEPAHGHSHDHGSHDHGHSHDHGNHDHGHSHDHANHNHGHSHDHANHDHGHDHGSTASFKAPERTAQVARDVSSVWLKAIISIFAISCCPLVILFFINVDNTDKHKRALEYLLSFASGGLLGDAFLHLIPHAVMDVAVEGSGSGHGHSHAGGHSHGAHGHSHGDDAVHAAHIGIGAWVLGGILAFLLVEVIMRAIRGSSGHGHSHDNGSDHSHQQQHGAKQHDSPIAPPQKKPKNEQAGDESDSGSTRRRTNSRTRAQPPGDEKDLKPHGHKHKTSDDSGDDKDHDHPQSAEDLKDGTVIKVQSHDMRVAAYLNLAADFAHNFTDGLAVGAGFLVGDGIGILTAVTVILHEIPHEIGDYAILVKSGCSKWKVTEAHGGTLKCYFKLMAIYSENIRSFSALTTRGHISTGVTNY